MDLDTMRRQLMDRLAENYAEYRSELLLKDRQELIDNADQIAGTAEVFQHLTEHRYTEQELGYLLRFQDPLEVVTDHWTGEDFLLDALDAVVSDLVDKKEDLTLYPLVSDTSEQRPSDLRKFMNVDLERVLRQIMAQKTAFYQTDLNYALDDMRQGIMSDDPAKRNFVVIFRQSGVECLNERDMMIAGTRSYNTCQYYHYQTTEPVLVYAVELLGDGSKGLRGNLYQRGQHQLARFTERASSPYTDVTITFMGGREVRIPEKEYNYETIPNLKYHYGDIWEVRNEADDESVVQGALRREHERRERLPRGYIAVHLQNLEKQRIQTEADRISSELLDGTGSHEQGEARKSVEVSPYFLPLASEEDMRLLFEKVRGAVDVPVVIDRSSGKGWQVFFTRREQPEQERKPSIRAQLAVKPENRGDHPPAKNKERGER